MTPNRVTIGVLLQTLRAQLAEIASVIDIARREKLLMFIGILGAVALAVSVVFYFAEHATNDKVHSFSDALYWMVITFTTVGYGDEYPTTGVGRLATVVMLLTFIALMPIVTATITTIYVSRRIKGESGLDKVTAQNHIVICGWNNNGNNILAGLQERREPAAVVLVGEIAADHFEDISGRYPELKLHYVRGPFSNEATLTRASVNTARIAIVLSNYAVDSTTRSDDLAVLCVLALRELGPQLRIVVECFASANRANLRRAGADRVIVSGELDGYLLAAASLAPGLDLAVKDALTFGEGSAIWTRQIPGEYVGRTFRDLAVAWLSERNWVLVGLVRLQRKLGISEVLEGNKSAIDDFIMRRFEQAGKARDGRQALHYLNPGPKHVIREDDVAIVIYPSEAA
jgi:voltage-gated potassium channel